MGRTILITGATGFLGSALCVGLGRYHRVTGLYRRPPSLKLRRAAPSVSWVRGDVGDSRAMSDLFQRLARNGLPIDYVIHFAAFMGFGKRWRKEYQATNVSGTRNVIEAAGRTGVERILFAGSIASLDPPRPGETLTERTAPSGAVAYARSKALGEKLFYENARRVPAVILRLGGVFTDWCELPPLFSLIKTWHNPVSGRLVPGRGLAGFPYIHRKDVVAQVKKIIDRDRDLNRLEVLFGAPAGATSQRELFPVVRRACDPKFSIRPVHVPPQLGRLILHGKWLVNRIRRETTYERAWMMDYADRPLVVDTTYTSGKLGWHPAPERHILRRLPRLMSNFKAAPRAWMIRNINRNDQKYDFDPDDGLRG